MKILAFSRSRREIAANIEEATMNIMLHLIKLWLYPRSRDKNKWRKEVAASLCKISNFKSKHTLPSKDFILKNSWYVHQKYFSYYVECIVKDYNKSSESTEILEPQAFKYFEWIASRLSERPYVAHQDIYSKLEELGF